jgi:hypothetical protein
MGEERWSMQHVGLSCDWPGCTERDEFVAESVREARAKARGAGWSVNSGGARCREHAGMKRGSSRSRCRQEAHA